MIHAAACLLAAALCIRVGNSQPLPSYTIYRAAAPISVDAGFGDAPWTSAPLAANFHFNWWKQGDREATEVRMLWDNQNLYVAYYCHDKHISAYERRRHGPVSKDDCVEIFLSPNPHKVNNYYTFEINAIGTMLNRCRTDWWHGPPTWNPDGVRYRTSFQGLPEKNETPGEDHWMVELAIPFRNFVRDAAHIPPRPGDVWRLNLFRTGGITNAQDSSWSPIPAQIRTFHTPAAFGYVRFSGSVPPTKTTPH